jgi:hypothetical protein
VFLTAFMASNQETAALPVRSAVLKQDNTRIFSIVHRSRWMSGRTGKVLDRRFGGAEMTDVDQANCKEQSPYFISNRNAMKHIEASR